jgi:iron complex outermembrane receptor protein
MVIRAIQISTILSSLVVASTVQLDSIEIQESISENQSVDSCFFENAKDEDVTSILYKSVPEISMSRSSAISSDIILRGFKKDDINVLINGFKVYGACPNRMDPPSMHVSVSQIKSVDVVSGAFDVENFGSLGGVIDVKTKEPQEGVHGDISATYGSFNYKKLSATVSAGDSDTRVLVGFSHASSDQYEDGDGKKLTEQVEEAVFNEGDKYQEQYEENKAYSRNSFWLNTTFKLLGNQELTFNAYHDVANDVLYPAFQMDAQLDATSMINGEYNIYGLGKLSDKLSLQAFYSAVEHDMGTKFRNSASPATAENTKYRTHSVDSLIKGAKVINDFKLLDTHFKVGLDSSIRNWDGRCVNDPIGKTMQVRIPDVDTTNVGLFTRAKREFGALRVDAGVRYDATSIKANNLYDASIEQLMPIQAHYAAKSDKDFDNVSANVVGKYALNENIELSLGIGQSIRVPDAQEMYFIGFSNGNWSRQGNPELKATLNRELDAGFDFHNDNLLLKVTAFYSDLENFIYAYKEGKNLTWSNIDAKIYGASLASSYFLSDELSVNFNMAYQKGLKKSQPSITQSDKDLASIPPLKSMFNISYDNGVTFASLELLSSMKYENFDADNAEVSLPSWSVLNAKVTQQLNKNIKLSLGVDNVFDASYTVDNSYVGRGIIASNESKILLINEVGRFYYTNLSYSY